jgi:alpha-glucosidase (family GH31 glycosyl hydrolase)
MNIYPAPNFLIRKKSTGCVAGQLNRLFIFFLKLSSYFYYMRKYWLSIFLSGFLLSCQEETNLPVSDEPYIPDWIFKHWVWEDEGTTASARQLADDYLAHGIPVDAIIIDSPWETGYNTFDWDPGYYPDAQGMIDYFHSKNIKVLTWITGVINNDVQPLYDSLKTEKFFMQNKKNGEATVIEWWKGDGSLFDYWNPAVAAWVQQGMDRMLDMGIDGWKCDGTDYYSLFSPYSPGADKNISRNDYSKKYYQFFNDRSKEKNGKDAVVMARPIDNYGIEFLSGDLVAFADKNMIFAGWVGDQDATFEGLKKALNNMYHSYQYGYLIFGSDIGGYREDDTEPLKRSKELFIRWAQLGAFSGLMENGGGGEHRPWVFDNQTLDIYKKLVLLRGQLVSYLVQSAKKAYNNQESLMQFQNSSTYGYSLGEEIFVAPVMNKTGNVKIQFPAGEQWVYLYDKSQTYDGGTSLEQVWPLDEFPVFIRQGSSLVDELEP